MLQFKNCQILPGMSGSPALNLATGSVCGVVKRSRDEDSLMGGRAVPVAAAFNSFADLAEVNRRFHEIDREWTEARGRPGARLRVIFDRLIADHPYFGGRGDVLVRIDKALDSSPKGYLIIEAESGFGKTALMVHLATRSGRETVYHFFSRDYGPGAEGFTDRRTFLASLREQLAEHHGDARLAGPDAEPELHKEVLALLRKDAPPGRPVVVLIDAADEADFSLRPVLGPLGRGVHVLVSARRMARRHWAKELPPPGESSDLMSLDPMGEDDIADLLRVAGGEAGPVLANDPAFVADLAALTLGDPFFLSLLMLDLRREGGSMTRAEVVRLLAVARPDGPDHRGLNAYLDGWWDRAAAALGTPEARALVADLAAAQAPLTRDDLIAIDPAGGLDAFTIDRALSQLGRFLVGDDFLGYSFNHDRFRNHVRRKLGVALRQAEERLVAYSLAWASRDDGQNTYAFAALTRHLFDACLRSGDATPLVDLLCGGRFLPSKARALRRFQPALADLALGLRLVATLYQSRGPGDLKWSALGEQAISLVVEEERFHELIEQRAKEGAVLGSAREGDFDGATAEALALSQPRDRVLQLALIAEAVARSGPDGVAAARRAISAMAQTAKRTFIPLSYEDEAELIEFVATAPPELVGSARDAAANLVRPSLHVEMDLAVAWERARRGDLEPAALPDLEPLIAGIKYEDKAYKRAGQRWTGFTSFGIGGWEHIVSPMVRCGL
ncbi:MAG TPA: AAA family ATPase, partial [Isosphaeraceae bacterium]|nr:AAA family ATPase [Isosphaeraceae bacterium]